MVSKKYLKYWYLWQPWNIVAYLATNELQIFSKELVETKTGGEGEWILDFNSSGGQ